MVSIIRGAYQKVSDEKSNKNRSFKAHLGFSLIELIIVIAIMAVLLGLVSPAVVQYVRKNKMKACHQNREAILAVYQRCVYDTSVPLTLSATDLVKVIPASKNTESDGHLYPPIKYEVGQYSYCPLSDDVYKPGNCGIGDAAGGSIGSGTAWIYCDECDDYASIDMVGWEQASNAQDDDKIPSTPAPSPSPSAEIEKVKVHFNLNGHGHPQPDDIELNKGDTLSGSSLSSPKDNLFKFKGWFYDSAGVNEFKSTKIEEDLTLYAKWEGVNSTNSWPYADDPTWWSEEGLNTPFTDENGNTVTHMDIVDHYQFNTVNNMEVFIKVPSGIFTSKSGGQFVFLAVNGTTTPIRVTQEQASSPEYYAVAGNEREKMMQLSGQVWTFTFKELKEDYNSQITDFHVQQGDLVYFEDTDSGNAYAYVVWNEPGKILYNNQFDAISSYDNKIGNLYRVQDTPIPITSYK